MLGGHMTDNDKIRVDLLKEAIHDTQETIKFTDTKAAAVTVFLTSISIKLIIEFATSFKPALEYIHSVKFGFLLRIPIMLLVFGLPTAILYLIFSIFSPRINPQKNIEIGNLTPKNLFFLAEMNDKRKIKPSLSDYLDNVLKIEINDVLLEYSYEFQKLSYIRIIKERRMKWVTWLVFSDLVIFLFGYYLLTQFLVIP